MNVLDGCAGTGSATIAFRERGDRVLTLDIDPSHSPDICMDVRAFALDPQRFVDEAALAKGWIAAGEHFRLDAAWWSPLCTVFSLGGSGKGRVRWNHLPKGQHDPFYGPRTPRDDKAREGCEIVLACLEANRRLAPRWWWLENPCAGLKTMGFMRAVPGPVVVSYCQYGDTRQKMTCLWGIHPPTWTPRPKCRNGDPCHAPGPRGSRTPGSTQGMKNARDRGMVPRGLSESIAAACHAAVGA